MLKECVRCTDYTNYLCLTPAFRLHFNSISFFNVCKNIQLQCQPNLNWFNSLPVTVATLSVREKWNKWSHNLKSARQCFFLFLLFTLLPCNCIYAVIVGDIEKLSTIPFYIEET